MRKTLPVSMVQSTIFNQLQASKEIFGLIPQLALVAERQTDADLKRDLEGIMNRLLEIGEGLSDKASDTGEKVLDLVMGRPQGATSPADVVGSN